MTGVGPGEEELSVLLGGVSPEIVDKEGVLAFYRALVEGNATQNLTRLISPQDFFTGHLLDVLELKRLKWTQFPAMDLGSGCGVPGLLFASLTRDPREKNWLLAESEARKADFLRSTAVRLSLADVRVIGQRAEQVLKAERVSTIVARAVGPVERIYGWIRNCSTWNTLILFKGPGWREEWGKWQASKYKKELRLVQEHRYTVGEGEGKRDRTLVLLERHAR